MTKQRTAKRHFKKQRSTRRRTAKRRMTKRHTTKRHTTKRRTTKRGKKRSQHGGMKPQQKRRIVNVLTNFIKPHQKQQLRKLAPSLARIAAGPFGFLLP